MAFYSCIYKVNFEEKSCLPLINYPSLVLPRSMIMLLLSNFRSIICKAVAYGRLKRKDNSKFLALNVAAVACERWSLTRGSKYSDMTGKLFFLFWQDV